MEKKRIVLVDDHVVIRNGLKELIEKLGPYHVVAEFDNGSEFISNVPITPSPDLVIMDLSMPEMDGDEVLEVLNEKKFTTPVLMLTLNQDDARIVKLFRLGARGYLQKNCTAAVLRSALEEIFRCGYYHNEFLAFSLQNSQVSDKRKDPSKEILEQLSDREREFLKHVCHEKEYTYDQIAGLMGVQHRTVDGYRESIFEKFGIKSKTGLVLFILRNQIFDKL
jgi:two-component system, NarL family, invasion response regulator UvrY